jgi:hypothetical protein
VEYVTIGMHDLSMFVVPAVWDSRERYRYVVPIAIARQGLASIAHMTNVCVSAFDVRVARCRLVSPD